MTTPRMKILIVDDQHANLVALRRLLGRVEADVIAAESGNDALALTLEHDFALILLDVNMPGMDGFEVAEWLSGAERTRHVPIIFVTASLKGDIARLRAYDAGAVDYIEKPINDVVLLSKVAVFLEIARQREDLRRLHAELEDRIRERTRDLSEEVHARRRAEAELRRARDAAEFANRAKTEFLANMSHELRTPLNAIIGFSELMAMEIRGRLGHPAYRDYANDILVSGRHLLNIIDDILDVAAIEAGRMELVFEDVDLRDPVAVSLRALTVRARNGGVRLVNTLPEGLPRLRADRRRLVQILLNLLTNAVKFTGEGGEVRVGGRLEADGRLAVDVADTGVGMDRATVESALRLFGRGNAEIARRHEGTGLGLPLTKGLVEEHGGTLTLSSELGRGTTVTVRFPAERVILA